MVTFTELEIFFTVAKTLGWLLVLGLLIWECHEVPTVVEVDHELEEMDADRVSQASFTKSPAPDDWV